MGRLIPAGTGIDRYSNYDALGVSEKENDSMSEAFSFNF